MATLDDSTIKFDAFAEEHEFLERALSDLRGMLTRRQDARAAIATLADLSDHVLEHFAHEEQDDGFFDNVIEQAPRLKQRATELIEEHAAIGDALMEMRLLASKHPRSEQWWSDLNTRFEAFEKWFFRHERAEIDIVQAAFQDDIGEAD